MQYIVTDHYQAVFPVEGCLLFDIPDNPYPHRPTLAYHDYGLEKVKWAKENAHTGRKLEELMDVETDSIIMKDDDDD